MIALRGKLERVKKEASTTPAAPPEITPPSTEEWAWAGHWAFGATLPDDEKKWQKFIYKWEKPVAPSEVVVISLTNAAAAAAAEAEAEMEEAAEAASDATKESEKPKEESAKTTTTTEEETKKEETKQSTNDATKEGEKKSEESKVETGKSEEKSKTEEGSEKPKEEGEKKENAAEDSKSAPTPEASAEAKKDSTEATESQQKPERPSQKSDEKSASATTADPPTTENTEASSNKRPKITFATPLSPDDPPFTDAGSKHPDKCPVGGQWKGYFENAIKKPVKRKNQVVPPVIQKIEETFHVYLNATPPPAAQTWFASDEMAAKQPKDNSATPLGILKEGLIHVRGTGENQFGNFELLGSFDVTTGTLECQRMYVSNAEVAPVRRRSSRSDGTGNNKNNTTSPDGRPYQTRKRQLSWKRRSLVGEDSDTNAEQTTRRRSGSGSIPNVAGGGPANKKVRLAEPNRASSTPDGSATPSTMAKNAAAAAAAAASELSITVPIGTMAGNKRPGPSPKAGTPRSKKAATGSGGSTPTSKDKGATPGPSPSNFHMKLPLVGDPKWAIWRGAHYLYYQKTDPSQEEGGTGGNSNSGSSNAAGNAYKYVVYEGEMLKSQREGKGVCLYSNQMLYEGQWKRNKEHGKGTLMTADRKRIIYQGEWERGRMHGRGIYYYSAGVVMNSKQQVVLSDESKNKKKGGTPTAAEGVQSCYEGDFKENLRHGYGKYILPDGSCYEGNWREGMMCGRGVFNWADGSFYDGEWKEGRRHGNGILRAADGFSYNGTWVNNAMEGRGTATYPNGQTYNGMFSCGRREGRGTIRFTNGAIYEGRFRDDAIDGQGTMKMSQLMTVPRKKKNDCDAPGTEGGKKEASEEEEEKPDFMIPLSFQSDMGHIHQKAGFTVVGE